MRKVFEYIGETYVLEPNFIKCAALQPQLAQSQLHPSFIELRGKQSLGFLLSDNFSAFRWKLQYYYCITSSVIIHAHFFKMKIL